MPAAAIRRCLRNLETAVHVGVHRTEDDTPCTVTPSLARSALNDWVMLNAAAFEME